MGHVRKASGDELGSLPKIAKVEEVASLETIIDEDVADIVKADIKKDAKQPAQTFRNYENSEF
jgi:hypothetical protein